MKVSEFVDSFHLDSDPGEEEGGGFRGTRDPLVLLHLRGKRRDVWFDESELGEI